MKFPKYKSKKEGKTKQQKAMMLLSKGREQDKARQGKGNRNP
jgi:hypothetical protein